MAKMRLGLLLPNQGVVFGAVTIAEMMTMAEEADSADVFDALTSSRVYKEATPPSEARDLIQNQAGRQFDPAVVEAFQVCYGEFLKVKESIDGEKVVAQTPTFTFDRLQSQPAPELSALD